MSYEFEKKMLTTPPSDYTLAEFDMDNAHYRVKSIELSHSQYETLKGLLVDLPDVIKFDEKQRENITLYRQMIMSLSIIEETKKNGRTAGFMSINPIYKVNSKQNELLLSYDGQKSKTLLRRLFEVR